MATNKTTPDAAQNETDESVEIPTQAKPVDAEVISLEEHMPTSVGSKIKNLLRNKKVLVAAGGVVLGIVAAVVVNSKRTDAVSEPAVEDESASA